MNFRRTTAFFILAFGLGALSSVSAERLKFQYQDGEKYRIVSRVDEEVYINDTFSHRADILNRIAVSVSNAHDGSGTLEAVFQTSERSHGDFSVYEWSEEYESKFVRDEFGVYGIDDGYFMPVVRDVPTFPDRELEPGETWSAPVFRRRASCRG